MLTESFVASVLISDKTPNTSLAKDAGIYLHDYLPLSSPKSSFKKSSTPPNGLAVSASHIFAAQAEKAVIHVYDREKRNQEAIVPFPEKITSIALAGPYDGAGILAMGTEGGVVFLWELCSGRLVSTPPCHLQKITCLAVDTTSNFLLSASLDSNIHVWSIPSLLSFAREEPLSPLRTLSNHRAAVTSVEFGHGSSSANIAVSGSEDGTCNIWDYHTGALLRTFLLSSLPLCLVIDPADRAAYAGYEDGSVQLIDFYKDHSIAHPLYNLNSELTPIQPHPSDRWEAPEHLPALSLTLSYDGTTLLSGHANGRIYPWDIAKRRYGNPLADFSSSSPITNMTMLPPSGFPTNPNPPTLKLNQIVKPSYQATLHDTPKANTNVPIAYKHIAQFTTSLPLPRFSSSPSPSHFHSALTHPSFPSALLSSSLTELLSTDSSSDNTNLQIATLEAQLRHAQAAQSATTKRMVALSEELRLRDADDKRRRGIKRRRRLRRLDREERRRRRAMGEEVVESESAKEEVDGEVDGVSSTTDELTDD